MFVLLTLPHAGMAALTPLSDVQMNDVTGQAGIAPEGIVDEVARMAFNNHFDNIPVMNGLLNLGDVTVQGAIETRLNGTMVSQITSSSLTGLPGLGIMGFGMSGLGAMSVGTHHINAAMDIDRLSIGAIRIGQDATGPSLGSLDIIGMHMTVRGTVSISVR
ncbi:MAG TPA: hypothetical protein PK213_06515 [Deltaproteobacteria bacterium]|jgi:hypothetical protein|nr:hypothetical protein [Deltaproteobacteria bacterium]